MTDVASASAQRESMQPVVLITGAAAGIGLAVARHLIGRSHRIIALDIDGSALDAAYADSDAKTVLRLVADVAQVDQVERAVAAGVEHFGGLHALVNNAALHGAAWGRPCFEYEQADWLRLFSVNVFAIPALARAALPALSRSGGVVVNMSSMVSYGHGPSSPYAVSKAAVNGLTVALSQELGKHGVRVVGLAPGFIATDVVLAGLNAAARERLMSLQTLPVSAAPEDIAEIIAFLISPAARLITGTTIVADLGITRRP